MSRRKERATQSEARGGSPVVLIVDDEADILELLELTLLRMGLRVERAQRVREAMELVRSRRFDLCLTDMRLSDGSGLELVQYIGTHCSDVPVAVITAYGSADNAVAALKAGAFDYLSKPVSLEQLRTLVKSALTLPREAATTAEGATLMGDSPAIRKVRAMIEKVARSQAPVHISGESGSGKELAARLIHAHSSRANGPFMPVNCGAIPENLMESEFFGYKKGAFTGAESDRDGFFQAANGGTLFLDEVADLPLAMQVKLLRVIQEKKARKVGATQEEPVDVRIISATHQDLAKCLEAGKFRNDLYYRLSVINLRMPALREMREDILHIARVILTRIAHHNGAEPCELEAEAGEALMRYDFPGNVRELENVLERAVALSTGGAIRSVDLQLSPLAESSSPPSSGDGKRPLQDYLDRLEKEAILEALGETGYNRTAAARLLGVTFRSLRYRMQRLEISQPDAY